MPTTTDELVERLAAGEHPVMVGGPDPSLANLKDMLERDYPFVKFVATRGGTDLSFPLDRAASRVDGDYTEGKGTIHLEGDLTLNYVPIRVVADIDLATLTGTGHLVIREGEAESETEAQAKV